MREEIFAYCEETYNVKPDYPFEKSPQHAVLRHQRNRKWFALLMKVSKAHLGLEGESVIDILTIKAPPEIVDILQHQKGFLPAYHMNKEHWLTILLNGEVTKERIFELLDDSFAMTR